MGDSTIFSKRSGAWRSGMLDSWAFDEIPKALRNQIIDEFQVRNLDLYIRAVSGDLLVEWGKPRYVEGVEAYDRLLDEVRGAKEYWKILDFVEAVLTCPRNKRQIDFLEVDEDHLDDKIFQWSDDLSIEFGDMWDLRGMKKNVVNAINKRFREHRVGYEFIIQEGSQHRGSYQIEGQVVRVDSQYYHAEVMKPTLQMLYNSRFKKAEKVFLDAHKHYLKGEGWQAVAGCGVALTEVLKEICRKRKWAFNEKRADIRSLVNVVLSEGLVDSKLHRGVFDHLRGLLWDGVPPARNEAVHESVEFPVESVAFVLHVTASAIVYLVAADGAKQR